MRDLATAQSEGGSDANAGRQRGRRVDPNAQSAPSADAAKPTSDGRQPGSWDSGGAAATNSTQHAPQAQPRGSLAPASDSITSLLSSMRLGGGDAVHSAPGGLGLEHTWARAGAIDLGNPLGGSSGTSELDSMFDSLMAEQRQLKAERRRSNGVASAPSSFARGLGSPNGRWGATQGLGSTQARRRWGGAVPLGTTSNFGPRATRGFATFRSVADNSAVRGGYGGTPQPGGGYGRHGGYNGYGGGVRSTPRTRRTFESIGAPASPGFGPPVTYHQGGFNPMDSMRSGLGGGDGGLPPPLHVSQEAARAHRRPLYQQPPPSQQGQHGSDDQRGFDYSYNSPSRGQPHYGAGAGQAHQQHEQGQYEPPAGTNYYRHDPPEQQQGYTGQGDELGQTTSSRFLDHGESEHYLDHV
jgi:hypothetical protein